MFTCVNVLRLVDRITACRAVVAESYRLWLQYEVRTDDITIILAFIDTTNGMKEASSMHQSVLFTAPLPGSRLQNFAS